MWNNFYVAFSKVFTKKQKPRRLTVMLFNTFDFLLFLTSELRYNY